jgi:recombination protein U
MAQGNRGAAFENLINSTNESYENRELAVINKRSTPVKVTRSKGTKVLAGFFEAKSTVDYDGIYRGRAVFSKLSQSKNLIDLT